MTLVRVAALLAVMTLLGACAHRSHPPMPCGCMPPPAEDPAKG